MKSSWIRILLSLKFSDERIVLVSVLRLHVFLQTALVQINSLLIFRTQRAEKRSSFLLHLVCQCVLFEIRSACKAFAAFSTFVRFVSCVNSLMSNQVGYLGERLSTANLVTNVRLLVIMNSLVFLERRVLNEGLRTMGTKLYLAYHEYGLSPVWVLSCSFCVFLHEKVFAHPSTEQMNPFCELEIVLEVCCFQSSILKLLMNHEMDCRLLKKFVDGNWRFKQWVEHVTLHLNKYICKRNTTSEGRTEKKKIYSFETQIF